MKYTLFIVEGCSEETLFCRVLPEDVIILKTNGDLTSTEHAPYKKKDMGERLDIFLNRTDVKSKYRDKEIERIVFLTDTDGCFISSKRVKNNKSFKKFVYEKDAIYSEDRVRVIHRNKVKAGNLDAMINDVFHFHGIPVEVYFMSCNLDHVLYGKRNASDRSKVANAYALALRIKNGEASLNHILEQFAVKCEKNYFKTWDYIKDGVHSLDRCSNLDIYFMGSPFEKQNSLEKMNVNLRK